MRSGCIGNTSDHQDMHGPGDLNGLKHFKAHDILDSVIISLAISDDFISTADY